MKSRFPYKECKDCRDLGDCPHPEVTGDLLGSPMPPDVCPKPIEVMVETLKKKNVKHIDYLNIKYDRDIT